MKPNRYRNTKAADFKRLDIRLALLAPEKRVVALIVGALKTAAEGKNNG